MIYKPQLRRMYDWGARPLIQPDANTVAHVRFVGAAATRTNLALQSQALGTTWTGVGAVAVAPTVTNNTVDLTAPDGTSTATKIVIPAVTAATGASYVKQDITAAAATYTGSMWLRTASGTATVWIWFGNPAAPGTHYGQVSCAVTTTWTRFQFAVTLTAGSKNFAVGVDTRDSVQGSQAGQTVYAWGAQMELGSTASLYITTAAAAVTVDDALVDLKGKTADVLTGNQWAMAGTVPQIARSGRTPGGAGPFSAANFYSLGTGSDVLDFAGDFSACLVLTPTGIASENVFRNGPVTTAGYWLVYDPNWRHYEFDPLTKSVVATSIADAVNVVCFGRTGTTIVIKANLGAYVTGAVAGIVAGTALPARIGDTGDGRVAFSGSVREAWFSTTTPSDALFISIMNRVKTRMGITAW